MMTKAIALVFLLLSHICATTSTTSAAAAVDHAAYCEPFVLVARDISLEEQGMEFHDADMMGNSIPFGISTNIDLYWCSLNNASTSSIVDPDALRAKASTLIVFSSSVILEVPGYPNRRAGKDIFTQLATRLAQQGYIVAIAEKPVSVMKMSAFLPVDFLRVIEYIDSGASPVGDVSLTAAVIGGHGFGGAMT